MYKNPELSNQAKRLRGELQTAGLSVSHAQAMELLAKAQGSRTLHVAHAKKSRQGIDINELALRQASDLVFDTLGRYEGNVLGLVESIRAAFLLEETEGSRAVEAAMAGIFEQPDSPRVSELFDGFMPSELPRRFEQTRKRLLATLEKQFEAPAEDVSGPHLLYRGPVHDWRVLEGQSLSELPEHHRTQYEVKVEEAKYQFFVNLAVPHSHPDELEGTDQLNLFIEVNDGRPCVHISNDLYGDQVLTVFATKDGLMLRPEYTDEWIASGLDLEGTSIRRLQDEEREQFPGHAYGQNHCFISTQRRNR